MSGLIIIPLIGFKIVVDNPSNQQLFLFGRLVIIVIIVDLTSDGSLQLEQTGINCHMSTILASV